MSIFRLISRGKIMQDWFERNLTRNFILLMIVAVLIGLGISYAF